MIDATLSTQQLHVRCTSLQAAGVVLSGEIQCVLNSGEVHVLRGANGVGKSTLLRALANALPGQAMLFKAEYGLRDELLVHDHLQNLLAHLNRAHTDMAHILAQVGLSDWQHERIGTLSSGQKARLGLCTLLVSPFRVWLLDEPLNALDTEGQQVLAKALEQHLQAGGFVFMATHVDPAGLLQQLPGVLVNVDVLAQGQLRGDAASRKPVSPAKPCLSLEPTANVPVGALIKRDWAVLWGNPQAVLWGALFHWMVLSFFGIGLGKTSVEFAQVATWVSLLLAVLLGAKDWFAEDQRVGWIRFLTQINPGITGTYWLVRVLYTACAQMLVLVPVTGLAALQFGLNGAQALQLIFAMVAGVWAIAPLLGLIGLLVMLTRGGAVLVYLFALPLLVPVLIFGLEASQAADLGRSALAPLAVLFSLGLLACLLGPVVARRLIQLIQE